MTGRLSTHVLDTARGRPAEGLRLVLDRIEGEARVRLAEAVTNADGRTDAPLLIGEAVRDGVYEITFRAGDWLRAAGLIGPGVAFLDEIPIRFGMQAGQHYHVPLLLSPYGYATYRGS